MAFVVNFSKPTSPTSSPAALIRFSYVLIPRPSGGGVARCLPRAVVTPPFFRAATDGLRVMGRFVEPIRSLSSRHTHKDAATCSLPTLSATHFANSVNYLYFRLRRQLPSRNPKVSMLCPPVIERHSTRTGNNNIIIMLRTIAAQLLPFATASPAAAAGRGNCTANHCWLFLFTLIYSFNYTINSAERDCL